MQKTDTVLMAHGSGGTMMRDIIEQLFFEAYAGDTLRRGDDAATLDIAGGRVAFSTDTFVVTPHFFPGGDIGHLAVCGTVNDVGDKRSHAALPFLRLRARGGLSARRLAACVRVDGGDGQGSRRRDRDG